MCVDWSFAAPEFSFAVSGVEQRVRQREKHFDIVIIAVLVVFAVLAVVGVVPVPSIVPAIALLLAALVLGYVIFRRK